MQAVLKQPPVVDPQLLNDCLVSARRVAENPDLTMRVGTPGGGSYHNSETDEFTLDPLHCTTRHQAIWTACHEGTHSWQTPGYSTLPLTKIAKEALFSKIGFSSTYNVIEDCAGNDGMVRGFPGLARDTVAVYQEQLDSVGGILGHPDIMRVVQQIGREPKFGLALKTVLNAWAQFRVVDGNFDKVLSVDNGFSFKPSGDSDVDQVLKEAELAIRTAINKTLSDGNEPKALVREIGLARFALTEKFVFPFIEKLVRLDIKDELRNQAAKKGAEKGAFSDKTQKEISDQQSKSNKSLADGNKGEEQGKDKGQGGEEGQGEGKNSQTQGAQKDGSPTAETATQSGKGKEAFEADNSEAEASGRDAGGESQSPAATEQNKSSQMAGNQTGVNPQTLDQQPGTPPAGVIPNHENSETKNQPALEQGESEGQESNGEIQPSQQKPVDVSKLSEQAQKEIDDYLKGLSPEEKEALEAQARQLLQDLDDAIYEALKPKTAENDNSESHQERKELEELRAAQAHSWKALGNLSQGLRDAAFKSSTPYQKIYLDIVSRIDTVEEHIREVFKLEDDEEWQKGYASGQKTTGNSAMSFEADASNYNQIWHRRSLATSYSYEFDLIVDRSGSMVLDDKMQQTKRAAVFLIELLARFHVPCSVRVFDDSVKTVKKWEDDAADLEVQKQIAESFAPQGGTDDAKAIAKAYQEAEDRQEKHKYILVLSDAESGVGEKLKIILKQVQDEGKVILFHFGIGPNTSDSHGFYAYSRGDLPITGEGSFFEVFTEVITELIAEPDLFKGPKNEQ